MESIFLEELVFDPSDSTNEECNITNLEQISDLIVHLENGFERRIKGSFVHSDFSNTAIPSVNILRLLFSLSSRPDHYILKRTNCKDNEELNLFYEVPLDTIGKFFDEPSLKRRSLKLLEDYVHILSSYTGSTEYSSCKQELYAVFKDLLNDLVVNVNKDHRIIGTSAATTFTSKNSLEPVNCIIADTDTASDNSSIISDSSDDSEILLNAHHDLATADADTNSDIIQQNGSDFATTKLSRGTYKFAKKITLFGEPLLLNNLNPLFNKLYNIWNLIQWSFYCANSSTEEQRISFHPYALGAHLIYRTYYTIIDLICRAVIYDFRISLNAVRGADDFLNGIISKSLAPSSMVPKLNKKNTIKDLVTGTVLFKLVSQLHRSPNQWYDRAVEFIFTGLLEGSKKTNVAKPCFASEYILLRRQHLFQSRHYYLDHIFSNDNIHSISLRFKLSLMIFCISLILDTSNRTKPLASYEGDERSFLSYLADALLKVKAVYFEEFFRQSFVDHFGNLITSQDILLMMYELSKYIIYKITRILNTLHFNHMGLAPMNSEANYKSLFDYLTFLNQEVVYSSFFDRTFDTELQFQDEWTKLETVLMFLLDLHLCLAETRILSSGERGDILNIERSVEKADYLKSKILIQLLGLHADTRNDRTRAFKSYDSFGKKGSQILEQGSRKFRYACQLRYLRHMLHC